MTALFSPGEAIGIIAGNGLLPCACAEQARVQGLKVFSAAHVGETDSKIEQLSDSCIWIKVGQLGKLIQYFKKNKIKKLTFAGGIKRVKLFGGVRLDLRGALFLATLRSRKDDAMLTAIATEFEREGIQVFAAHQLLPSILAQAGLLTRRALNAEEQDDAAIAWEIAGNLGAHDVGQAVVAFHKTVIAVEAVEGTDAMIARAGELTGKRGGTLVKRAKPQQDLRLDLPTVGVGTIGQMQRYGLRALVLEAQRSIILDPQAVVTLANQHDIAVRVKE